MVRQSIVKSHPGHKSLLAITKYVLTDRALHRIVIIGNTSSIRRCIRVQRQAQQAPVARRNCARESVIDLALQSVGLQRQSGRLTPTSGYAARKPGLPVQIASSGVKCLAISAEMYEMEASNGAPTTREYLGLIGTIDLPALTSPFDPGYDPATLESHLEQSAHLISSLKISMACWMVADESATRRKIQAARARNVPVVTGGGPFEIAVAQGELEAYLDLCAGLGIDRIECGEGFTDLEASPLAIVRMAHARGLAVQYEMGKKHEGPFTDASLAEGIARSQDWLDAGATHIIVEARESAAGVGAFDADGVFNTTVADTLAAAFGFDVAVFEAPNKPSQFAMLNHFGPRVQLSNVRLEELLRVEIYRRGLHSDAFAHDNLRPVKPEASVMNKLSTAAD